MPLESWIQHSRHDMFLYDWQTLIAGVLAVVAAAGTIWATIGSANREIAAAQAQIATTLRLERRRVGREDYAFFAMLAATMDRVLAEADDAKSIFMTANPRPNNSASSGETFRARQRFTKSAFPELRSAFVRYGGLLTAGFLKLENEIDDFASNHAVMLDGSGPFGWNRGFLDQLAVIEATAKQLLNEAATGMNAATAVLRETEP